MTAKIHTRNAETLQKEQNMKEKRLVLMIGVLVLAMVAGCRSATGNGVVHVTGVSLAYTTAQTSLNNEFTIPVTVFPENATNKEVTWRSTNPDYITVDEHTGLIKCVQEGENGQALIIVTSKDGNKTSVCYVVTPDHL